MAEVKEIIRSLTPPVLWRAAGELKSHRARVPWIRGFEGPLSSWAEAVSRSDGWNSQTALAKTLRSALQVRDGLAAMEQDGNTKDRIIYSHTITSFLLMMLSIDNANLNIIDFGGGLCANYFQYQKILKQCSKLNIKWNIVEHSKIVELGVTHFENANVKFFDNLDDAFCILPKPYGILFSGSLQCIDKPFEVLDRVISNGIKIIAFDRILLSPKGQNRVFARHPDPIYFPSSYPVWCFSNKLFVKSLTIKGYELVEHFTDNPERDFDIAGMIFTRDVNDNRR